MTSKTATIAVLSIVLVQCMIIVVGNSFAIFVFWIHRNKLNKNSFILINLAVADLLVGVLDQVDNIGYDFPRELRGLKAEHHHVLAFCRVASACASIFFLVLISFERAFALIQPFRHRTTSTKVYIVSIIIVWLAGLFVSVFHLLSDYELLDMRYYVAVSFIAIALSLFAICLSYLAIRTKLNHRGPNVTDPTHNRKIVEQNTKLSKTLFIVIAASLVFWVPSISLYLVHYLNGQTFSGTMFYIITVLYRTNSLVNPVIYSFRIPMFKETLKRMKMKRRILKKSEKYSVNVET